MKEKIQFNGDVKIIKDHEMIQASKHETPKICSKKRQTNEGCIAGRINN